MQEPYVAVQVAGQAALDLREVLEVEVAGEQVEIGVQLLGRTLARPRREIELALALTFVVRGPGVQPIEPGERRLSTKRQVGAQSPIRLGCGEPRLRQAQPAGR